MNNQETQQVSTYGIKDFFVKTASMLKECFNGKSNTIRSCICIVVIALFSALLFSFWGVLCSVTLVITACSVITELAHKTFVMPLKSAVGSFWGGLCGREISKAGRIILILVTTVVPFLIALFGIPYLGTFGICLFFSARSSDAIPILFADSFYGTVGKKNFNRTLARRYLVGFGAGLFLFGSIFGLIYDFGTAPGSLPGKDVEVSVKAEAGTLGEFEAAVTDGFNAVSDYRVILETSEDNEDGTCSLRYGLYSSDDVTVDNYNKKDPVSKVTLTTTGLESDSAIISFNCELPYYTTLSIDPESANCAELERFSFYIMKGIMPSLSDKQIKKLYKDLYIPDEDAYREIGESDYVKSAWWSQKLVNTVTFGKDDSCFMKVYYTDIGAIQSSQGHFWLTFENMEARLSVVTPGGDDSSSGMTEYAATTFNNYSEFKTALYKFNNESTYNVFWQTYDIQNNCDVFALWFSDQVNSLNYWNYETTYSASVKFTAVTAFDGDIEYISALTVPIPYYGLSYIDTEDNTEMDEIIHFTKHVLKSLMPDLTDTEIEDIYKKLDLPTRSDLIEYGSGKGSTETVARTITFGEDKLYTITSFYANNRINIEFTYSGSPSGT